MTSHTIITIMELDEQFEALLVARQDAEQDLLVLEAEMDADRAVSR